MVLAPVLFFAVLEAGLRLGGYGYPTSVLRRSRCRRSLHEQSCSLDGGSFRDALARKPVPCFLSAKPAGTIRIFVLGSSAAQGVPNPSFSFGRILEVMLRERYPDVKFEVVNAAMTAINSHVALEIARDCAAHQPDLFVVYMGNNEVVGPYGPGTVFQQWSPSLTTHSGECLGEIDAHRAVAGRRDGYGFGSRKGSPTTWQGMEMFMGNQVAADDPRLPAVYDNFRQNLIDICGIARRAGAGVILSTVAVNLKDCPPLASQHRSDLSPEELAKWKSLYQAGVELERKEKWPEAIAKYEAAAKIDDRFAELAVSPGPMSRGAGPMGGGPRAVCLGPRLGRLAVSRRLSDQRDHPRGGRRASRPPAFAWWMRNNRWPRATWPSAAFPARTCSTSTFTSRSTGTTCWRGPCWTRSRRPCRNWPPSRKQEPVLSKRAMRGIAGADPLG